MLWALAQQSSCSRYLVAGRGGLFDLARENYKIKRFHEDLEAGKYLIMVGFKKTLETTVKELMGKQHPEAKFSGMESTWIIPLKWQLRKHITDRHTGSAV